MKLRKHLNEGKFLDEPLQAMANMVGPGGIMPSKEVSDFLKKAHGLETELKKITPKMVMDSLEDWNYHTEYAIMQAMVEGRKSDLKVLIAIATEQQKKGHIPADLSALRSYMGNRKWFADLYKPGSGVGVKGRVDQNTWKFLKLMDKKDAENFVALYTGEDVKKPKDIMKAVKEYIKGVQKVHDDDYKKNYKNLTPPEIIFKKGGRYIKVIRKDRTGSSQSVHSFVDTKEGPEYGNIYKPAGWKAPAKGARGNVFSAQNGMEAISKAGGGGVWYAR